MKRILIVEIVFIAFILVSYLGSALCWADQVCQYADDVYAWYEDDIYAFHTAEVTKEKGISVTISLQGEDENQNAIECIIDAVQIPGNLYLVKHTEYIGGEEYLFSYPPGKGSTIGLLPDLLIFFIPVNLLYYRRMKKLDRKYTRPISEDF